MAQHFDSIIIGAGQAGPALAERLGKTGRTVAIVERGKVGGTCVNYGCIPTKALVANARAIHMTRRGKEFGFSIESVDIDMQAIHDRMKRISGESNDSVRSWIEQMENVQLHRADATFTGARTLDVDGEEFTADEIFVNVGARARIPDIKGIDDVSVLTNREMLELTEVPDDLVIVGGSYVGLEFGQMFRRFGSEVTIVERSERIISREDPDVSDTIQSVLEREGVDFRLSSRCIGLQMDGDDIVVETDCGAEPLLASHVLVAAGRVPNTDRLGTDAAGIDTNDRGYITVDDQLRTSADGVWAMGDCNGQGAFTHTSWNDYEIVAANLLDDDPRRVSDRILCYGLFVDPPLGRIGMTRAQALESGRHVLVGKRPMSRVGRAREMSETDGFIEVLVDADSEEILGAAVLGVHGDEVVHSLLDVMYAKAPYTTISRAVHIHPTVSELVPTTLQDLKPLE